MLKDVLESIFLNADVVVEEDTYAAIYATVGVSHRPAVVCILGTRSCEHDNSNPYNDSGGCCAERTLQMVLCQLNVYGDIRCVAAELTWF